MQRRSCGRSAASMSFARLSVVLRGDKFVPPATQHVFACVVACSALSRERPTRSTSHAVQSRSYPIKIIAKNIGSKMTYPHSESNCLENRARHPKRKYFMKIFWAQTRLCHTARFLAPIQEHAFLTRNVPSHRRDDSLQCPRSNGLREPEHRVFL